MRLRTMLLMAVAAGILTGLAEIATLFAKKILFDRWINVSSQIIWMAPLAAVAVFLFVALLLWPVASKWPRRLPPHVVAGIFAFLGCASVALIFPSLHWSAHLLLPAGLGAMTARILARWSMSLERNVPRIALALAIVVITCSAGLNLGYRWNEQRAIAGSPQLDGSAPSVLLLILDTVRAQSLGLLGGERENTPHLERIAASGVSFEAAYSTAPWTLPAHASMFTGRYPDEFSADWETPLDNEHATLAGVLAAQGWLTAGFVANIAFTVRETGIHRGFQHYEDFPVSLGQVVLSSSLTRLIARNGSLRAALGFHENLNRKPAAQINDSFLRWLDRSPADRPFFAFLNYCDAHEPYLPPDPYRTMFGSDSVRDLNKIKFSGPFQSGVRVGKQRMSPEEVQGELAAYESAIAYIDQQIARLVEQLELRGRLQNTLIVITSDHGEHFGEHGYWEHGRTLYPQLLHVPLVVRLPAGKVIARREVTEPVSLVDLPATILDIAGVRGNSGIGGTSLAGFWGDGDVTASPVLAMVSPGVRAPPYARMESLTRGPTHYIVRSTGRTELFDLASDPRGMANLIEDSTMTILADSMGAALADLLNAGRGRNAMSEELSFAPGGIHRRAQ